MATPAVHATLLYEQSKGINYRYCGVTTNAQRLGATVDVELGYIT